MSRSDVNTWLKELQDRRLIRDQHFEGLDIEAYLDMRDEAPFADEWMQAYERYAGDPAAAEDEVLRQIRETAFKQTISLTGDPEIAGYVSDDFGLIGLFLLQEVVIEDTFVHQLLESYRQGTLPLRS